jgi:antitoxin ParD1/3/4
MNVSLTPELENWVDEKVRTGRYASASEVIREALRLLEIDEAAKQRRLIDVRQKIDRGLEQLDQGRGLDPVSAREKMRAARKKK